MQGYGVNIIVEGGELEKILARLSAAQEEIQQCYFELERLGVLVIITPRENAGFAERPHRGHNTSRA